LIDTFVQTGEIPIKYGEPDPGSKEPKVLKNGNKRETRDFQGKTFNLEHAIQGEVAMVRAWKVDEAGNCVFR